MNKPRRSTSISAQMIEQDLKRLFQTEADLCISHSKREGDQPTVRLEDALMVFDHLRTRQRTDSSVKPEPIWTHPSVTAMGDCDPISEITARARRIVLRAIEKGWSGPPYNPLALAEMRGMTVLPTEQVLDARTFSNSQGRFTLEFNPHRPSARMRFSIAHEIGHTLFSDCAAAIRNRATHTDMKDNDWQLESLCNIAAAEILMPIGTFQEELSTRPTVGQILELRRKYSVSCEAVVNRLIKLSNYPCFAFLARFDPRNSRYLVEYRISSAGLKQRVNIRTGTLLPKISRVSACAAIGERGYEDAKWISSGEQWLVEYLGISPNTGETIPRILGIASQPPSENWVARDPLVFIEGDATEPFGAEAKVLVQVVNDKAQIWGGGFARQVRKKWPSAQSKFREWTFGSGNLKLGNVHLIQLRDELMLASLIAQHGFGPATSGPRIRYGALFSALEKVREIASSHSASVHMPRIGAGEAGGSWEIIEGIIRETLISNGTRVVVYDLPSKKGTFSRQPSFEFPQNLADRVL